MFEMIRCFPFPLYFVKERGDAYEEE